MKCVADTNVFLAVALDEPEKPWLVEVTQGMSLSSPAVLPYELGNAVSALVKRRKLLPAQATEVWDVLKHIPVELIAVDVRAALELSVRFGIYAYDAYVLQTSLQLRCPVLTLDQRMRQVAQSLDIKLMEQP